MVPTCCIFYKQNTPRPKAAGVFANPRRARRLLGRLHAITDQDARIIAESVDIYQTMAPCA
jgi:hypothetical protein